MSAPRRSRLAFLALAGGVLALGLTPLAPLLILQPSTQVAGNLAGTGAHPWLRLPVAWIQPTLLIMACFSAACFLLALLCALFRREPRWIVSLSLLLSLIALIVWLTCWDQAFAWRELYRDLGLRE